LEAGKYLFTITLEHVLIGLGTAKYSAMGNIKVEFETPRSEIESDIVHFNSRNAKKELTEQGYIVSDNDPRTLSLSIKPQ
jgi:hypothetical protein